MKIYTLWQMQNKNPDYIIITSRGENTKAVKQFTKDDTIPQFLWEEEVKSWSLLPAYTDMTSLRIEI